MRLARFARAAGLLLVLSFDGLVAGCGPVGQQGTSAEGKTPGKIFAAERKELQQERKQAKRQGKGRSTKSTGSAEKPEPGGAG
jgi:hypothetical protein